MITIEDLLEELEIISTSIPTGRSWRSNHVNPVSSPADRKFIQDLTTRTRSGGKFSSKQAFIARKIISKYAMLFGDDRPNLHHPPTFVLPADEVLEHCENPNYRNALYQSTEVPREIRYIGNRKVALKCKFSPPIIDRIKALNDTITPNANGFPYFNRKYRIWVVLVTERNIESLMSLIKKYNFKFDDNLVQFLTDCSNASSLASSAIVNNDEEVIHVVVQHNNLLASWLDDIVLVEGTF